MPPSQTDIAGLLAAARRLASMSPDPNTKVGCLLVQPDRPFDPIAGGCNDFPTGVRQNPEHWQAPAKYDRVLHAEAMAVADAARRGRPTQGALAVITKFPCGPCVRLLLQSGIGGIVAPRPDGAPQWAREYEIARALIGEAGIGVYCTEGL